MYTFKTKCRNKHILKEVHTIWKHITYLFNFCYIVLLFEMARTTFPKPGKYVEIKHMKTLHRLCCVLYQSDFLYPIPSTGSLFIACSIFVLTCITYTHSSMLEYLHVSCISHMSDIGLHSRCKDVVFPPYTCISCIFMFCELCISRLEYFLILL